MSLGLRVGVDGEDVFWPRPARPRGTAAARPRVGRAGARELHQMGVRRTACGDGGAGAPWRQHYRSRRAAEAARGGSRDHRRAGVTAMATANEQNHSGGIDFLSLTLSLLTTQMHTAVVDLSTTCFLTIEGIGRIYTPERIPRRPRKSAPHAEFVAAIRFHSWMQTCRDPADLGSFFYYGGEEG
jgi:hypothetical protein